MAEKQEKQEKQEKSEKPEAKERKVVSKTSRTKVLGEPQGVLRKKTKKEQAPKKRPEHIDEHEVLVRILGYDIPGSRNLYTGLTRIKGISWTISNAVCLKLGFPKNKRVSELSKSDIQKIEGFLKALPVHDFLKNRRIDIETGRTGHFFGTDLEMKRDFDIKRLREIKSYKGIRHALKQPVKGQRTRSHFRTKGRAMGVRKK